MTRRAFIWDSYIDSTNTIDIWIECAGSDNICTSDVSAKAVIGRVVEPGVRPRASLKWGITLAGLRVNYYYIILFINLIVVLLDNAS